MKRIGSDDEVSGRGGHYLLVDQAVAAEIQARINRQAKPKGSLGRLEEFARQFVAITGEEAVELVIEAVRGKRVYSGWMFAESPSLHPLEIAGAALSAKRGDTPKSKLKGASKEMAASMTEKQLEEHGAKIDAATKTEVEEAIAAVKTALEGGDADDINAKSQALTQSAMKMGQQIYEQQQAAGPDAEAETAGETPADDDVVDAEFSEVDEDKKG